MKQILLLILIIFIIYPVFGLTNGKQDQNSKKTITVSEKAVSNIKDKDMFCSFTESINIVIPFGTFSDAVELGIGGIAEFKIDNYFQVKGIVIGAEVGFIHFEGKEKNTEYFRMIPLFLSVGYRFSFAKNFYFLPELYAGGSVNIQSYNDDTSIVGDVSINYSQKTQVEPAAKIKLRTGYMGKLFFFSISGMYGTIFEKTGLLQYVAMSFDAGVQF
mgnify:CR=1 FL=1